MGPHIALTKNCILQVCEELKKLYPAKKLRLSYVVYRDYLKDGNEDPSGKLLEVFKFAKDNENAFKENLEKVKATGGDDGPEEVFAGIEAVCDLEWSSKVKIIFFIADAPAHGVEFHEGMADNFPISPPPKRSKKTYSELFKVIRQEHEIVDFYFLRINASTDKMIAKLNDIAKAYDDPQQQKINQSDPQAYLYIKTHSMATDPSEYIKFIVQTVTQSVSRK